MVREDKLNIVFQDGGCGGHLGFLIGKILYTFDLQFILLLRAYNISFNLTRPMVQEQPSKIDFQDGGCGGYFGFLINTILAISISTGRPVAPSYVSTQFAGWFCEQMSKTDAQDGGYGGRLGYPIYIDTILAQFNPEVVLALQCRFRLSSAQIKVWEEMKRCRKLIFKIAAAATIVDFRSTQF